MSTERLSPTTRPLGVSTCAYVTGETWAHTCPQSATAHLAFGSGSAGMENAMFCDQHAPEPRHDSIDEHPIGPVCGMPETRWVSSTPDETGMCLWAVDDPALADAANGLVEAAR